MQKTVSIAHLKASLHCAAAADIRSYLKGVLFQQTPNGLYLVSTNGHMLSRLCVSGNPCDVPCDVIVPYTVVKAASKGRGKNRLAQLVQLVQSEGGQWELNDIPFIPLEGKFPDYERVIPDAEPSNEVGQFNCEYLYAAERCLQDFYSSPYIFSLYHNGPLSPATMYRNKAEAVVVIMPTRI